MSEIYWTRMTWRQIRDARQRNPAVLIPIGTVETQGAFNVLGLETILVERLAEEVAQRTSSLVLPAIPFGYSDGFHQIPGTISISPHVLEQLYEEVFCSVLRDGFDHVLFLAAHAPNQPILERVLYRVRDAQGVLGACINPGRMAPNYVKELFPRPAEARGHGAEPGLSLGEYLCPGDVDRAGAEPSHALPTFRGFQVQQMTVRYQDFDVLMPLNMEDIAPETCGYGDPTQGGLEQGRIMFERMADALTAFVEDFRRMDTHSASR